MVSSRGIETYSSNKMATLQYLNPLFLFYLSSEPVFGVLQKILVVKTVGRLNQESFDAVLFSHKILFPGIQQRSNKKNQVLGGFLLIATGLFLAITWSNFSFILFFFLSRSH